MNVLSYSLFGEEPMYCTGAIKNAQQALQFYPGWKCFFWHDDSVPESTLSELSSMQNVVLINVGKTIVPGRYWRFNLFNDQNVDVFCVRDTDSRLSEREVLAVNDWLQSEKIMHVMRDHPHHNYIVMAGMWGFKNKKSIGYSYENKLNVWLDSIETPNKIDDTMFLNTVFGDMSPNILVHDDWLRCQFSKKFPKNRQNQRFIGEIFNEKDEPMFEHYRFIECHV